MHSLRQVLLLLLRLFSVCAGMQLFVCFAANKTRIPAPLLLCPSLCGLESRPTNDPDSGSFNIVMRIEKHGKDSGRRGEAFPARDAD